MNSLTAQILVDIVRVQLGLDVDQVWIRDQNKKIPNDNRLYVIVGMVDSSVISATSEAVFNEENEEVEDVQRVIISENIQIDIFSRSNAALSRRWEIVSALRSIYSQQRQEENFFKIYRIPRSFLNTSDAEGGSRLNRFSLTFACQVWYKKIVGEFSGGDYYNDFDTRADDANTIGEEDGLFQFNITEPDEGE